MARYIKQDNEIKRCSVGEIRSLNSTKPLVSFEGDTYLRTGVLCAKTAYPSFPDSLNPIPGMGWVSVTLNQYNGWGGCAYGLGLFVAVLDYSSPLHDYYVSSDGLTWTKRTFPIYMQNCRIIFGNGLFLCVGNDQNGVISSDGLNWTPITFVVNGQYLVGYNTLGFGNGLFLFTSSFSGAFYSSADGVTWNAGTLPCSVTSFYYENGMFFGCANSTSYCTSVNGTTWILRTAPSYFKFVRFINGLYVAFTTIISYGYYTSTDGINWELQPAPFGLNDSVVSVVVADGYLVCLLGTVTLVSSDGLTWQRGATPSNTYTFPIALFAHGVIVAFPVVLNGIPTISTHGLIGSSEYTEFAYVRVA